MINVRYALIGRDGDGNQLAIVGTHHEPLTKHNKVAPKFHTLLIAEKTGLVSQLSYSVNEHSVLKEVQAL